MTFTLYLIVGEHNFDTADVTDSKFEGISTQDWCNSHTCISLWNLSCGPRDQGVCRIENTDEVIPERSLKAYVNSET